MNEQEFDYLLEDQLAKECPKDLFKFTKFNMRGEFDTTEFHTNYYKLLTLFAQKEIKKLIITVSPQSGKSLASSRMLPAFVMGNNPDTKITIASYNASLARQFNVEIQQIMQNEFYQYLFPHVDITQARKMGKTMNRDEVQIPNFKGSIRGVGRGGALTGMSVDLLILDDLYKDWAEANSPLIRHTVIHWYTTVALKRLHNESQQLIVFTRWHHEDLVGWLEEQGQVIELKSWEQVESKNIDESKFYKLNYPALMDKEPTEFDTRKIGEALYPKKHNREKLEAERALDPERFESLNQGNPRPLEGLVYKGFKTWLVLPTKIMATIAIIDTADKGKDYTAGLSAIIDTDGFIYITDVYYSDDTPDITENEVAEFLLQNQVPIVYIESNAGGASYARNIRDKVMGKCYVEQYTQTENKEARILTNSATAQRIVLFPDGWIQKYPLFSKHLLYFKKVFGTNEHDDAPDVLTALVERVQSTTRSSVLYT